MTAYYNEIDKYAAAWLRNLIAAGHIAPGVVDERSIEDVTPDDLRGFTQCHFFAGIGVWSLALRRAGWADDREIWTGSCPCQPFSAAGAGAGFADERHLWPAFHHLIAERRPAKVLGEQVASSHVNPWIDLVHADLEALGYGFAGVAFPSAGVGAPHIRDRLYWVADAVRSGSLPSAHARVHRDKEGGRPRHGELERPSAAGGMAHHDGQRLDGEQILLQPGRPQQARAEAAGCGGVGGLADAAGPAGERNAGSILEAQAQVNSQRGAYGRGAVGPEHAGLAARPGPTNGYWRDADWLGCTDGKWRPVEPGTFPLAHGASGRVGRVRADQERLAANVPRKDQGSRVGRLRAYGNAINAEAARAFIEAVMECAP